MKFLSSFFLMLAVSASLHAQTLFTEQVQKSIPGEGTVIIYQDPSLDVLLNGVERKKVETPKPVKPEPKHVVKKVEHPKNEAHKIVVHEKAVPKKTEDSSSFSTVKADEGDAQFHNKVFSRSYATTGYRIQLYTGNNSREARQKACSVGYLFKSRYPDIPVYTHFYSPRWICRAGNFKSYGEASKVLSELRGKGGFGDATIIKTKIQVGVNNGE